MRSPARCLPLVATLAMMPPAVAAQHDGEASDAPHVFYDCQARYCWDFDYTRREIPYVNWVRDRQDADVHVLISALRTGGGGWAFTLDFIGLRTDADRRDTLSYTSEPTDTEDDIRSGLVRVVRLGLVPFVARTRVGERLDVRYTAPEAGAPQDAATAEDDPWNFWTFRISGNGSSQGESEQRFLSTRGSLSASRVTAGLKVSVSTDFRTYRQEYDYADTAAGIDTTFVSTQSYYGFDALVARSLTEHWSAGLRASADRASTLNQDLAIWIAPAVEYNFYPYDEATHRQVTVEYAAGITAFDYAARTIFGKDAELLPQHRLSIGFSATQPWGSVGGSVFSAQYLHDLSKYHVGVGGSASIRIFRGLSFNLFGEIARIKDQLYLAQEGLTSDEVLLQQSVRGTNFRYWMNFGLQYRFGSKFANVVNTRMGGGGGMMIIN